MLPTPRELNETHNLWSQTAVAMIVLTDCVALKFCWGAANSRLQYYTAGPPVAISESLVSFTIRIRNDQVFLFFLKTNAYIRVSTRFGAGC